MTSAKPRVGCIGAGVLGAAIMQRLIDTGFAPVVWNRDPAKLAPLVKAGAVQAANPGELTRASAMVITCVSDGNALEAVVFGDHGVASAATADKILVDMSTCSAAQTQQMAARLASARGMAWLDAPISGGAPPRAKDAWRSWSAASPRCSNARARCGMCSPRALP